jgi:hypothetical protein
MAPLHAIKEPHETHPVYVFHFLLAAVGCSSPSQNTSDILVTGGTIITIDAEQSEAEAMVIRDGRIVAVGVRAELESRHPNARVHDLAGRTVIPGVVDSHVHP